MPEKPLDVTIDDRIRKIIDVFNRQIVTAREAVNCLVDHAAYPEFCDHLGLVPQALISHLRQIALDAPSHPEDFMIIQTVCASESFDTEAHWRNLTEHYYWGARHLREYFYPELPPPLFEPIKLIGVVNAAMERDGSIAIFGDIDSLVIRNNPIQLVTPDGRRLDTSVIRQDRIKRECDATSSEWYVREHGQNALFLDRRITAIAQVPLQTEVWVDRTAVAEIHPPVWPGANRSRQKNA